MTTTFPSSPRSLAIGLSILALLLTGACAAEPEPGDALETLLAPGEIPTQSNTLASNALPTDGYYAIQRDYRRCAAPFCGGYFITALNDVEACPEVAQRPDGACYVADIEAFYPLEDGDVVHVSSFDPWPFSEAPFLIASVDAVFASVLGDTYSTGSRLVFDDEGVRTVARVNTPLTGTPRRIVASARNNEELDLIVAAYNENRDLGGALTEGFLRGAQTYVVTDVWAAKQNYCVYLDEEDALTAWNADSLEQAEAIAAGTSATITAGFCADQRQVCIEIFQPIYGRIDADGGECTRFSNSCFFTAAVHRAAGGPGNASKAQGTYCNPGICVVADRDQNTRAWNFDTRADAADLLAGLEEEGNETDVTIYDDGYCGDQLLACTREFNPVSGTIDALGEVCVDGNNPCEFRSEVIAAAGGAEAPGKAQGTYELGTCDGGRGR